MEERIPMPYARRDTITWQPGMYYHIYNRGAHRMPIFRESKNYAFVLQRIEQYARICRLPLSPVA